MLEMLGSLRQIDGNHRRADTQTALEERPLDRRKAASQSPSASGLLRTCRLSGTSVVYFAEVENGDTHLAHVSGFPDHTHLGPDAEMNMLVTGPFVGTTLQPLARP
jgi:hypothetical protein